ncbi:hypothetical protein PTKIN_Ptkin09bG0049500 [Pterospermum kingtungense]
MGVIKQRIALLLFSLLFISYAAQFGASIRPLQREQLFRHVVPNFESLSKGLVPPSAGNPCTNIPGGSGQCVVNEMNVAGPLLRSPPAPHAIKGMKFGGTAYLEA